MFDAFARLGYRTLYRAARVYWFVVRPRTSGAVVALWSGGRVLLVRSSYRPHYGFPGGFLRRGESPDAGASRELYEEIRLRVPPARLVPAWHGMKHFEHREDTITIFETTLEPAPPVSANARELVWAGWKTSEEALSLELLPHVRDYLTIKSTG